VTVPQRVRANNTVLLVDDHQIIRDTLEAMLARMPGFSVVAQADNGLDAVSMCQQWQPDIVVLDMDLPGLGGLEVLHQVRALLIPAPRFVILSMFGDPQLAQKAMRHGALGYVHKSSGLSEIRAAIEAAAEGREHLCATIAPIMSAHPGAAEDGQDGVLTARERQVLQCVAVGMNAKQTARKLKISPSTVHVFRARIRTKLGISSQADMVRAGIRLGLAGIEAPHFE